MSRADIFVEVAVIGPDGSLGADLAGNEPGVVCILYIFRIRTNDSGIFMGVE